MTVRSNIQDDFAPRMAGFAHSVSLRRLIENKPQTDRRFELPFISQRAKIAHVVPIGSDHQQSRLLRWAEQLADPLNLKPKKNVRPRQRRHIGPGRSQ